MSSNHISKKIEIGKFYLIHDGSKTGHPGFIVWKDDENNRYLVIRFDSDKLGKERKDKRGIRHITKLKYPIDKNILNSYVKNRPMLCKRRDIGTIDLSFLKINIEDIETIIKVAKKNPELSPSLKRK